jgi:hypothetical protein
MEDELQEMLKDSFVKLFTRENGLEDGELTAPTLFIYPTLDSVFYMRSSWLRKSIFKDLHDLGAAMDTVVMKCK